MRLEPVSWWRDNLPMVSPLIVIGLGVLLLVRREEMRVGDVDAFRSILRQQIGNTSADRNPRGFPVATTSPGPDAMG